MRKESVHMFKVIVPTRNAAHNWPLFISALLACARPDQVLIIDSESTDGTALLAQRAGFQVCSISQARFNHGGTRQMGADMLPNSELLVYLTQDSVLTGSRSLANLLACFADPQVGAAYGRQLPRPEAGVIEAHARTFNYPAVSEIRSLGSRVELGIRAAFMSNALAAYRHSALLKVGGFPRNVIFGEDTITAARMLLAGYKIAYVAESCAYHSHSYSWIQEFKRYFDIGVLHTREEWLLEEFGKASREGKRFVISELRFVQRREPWKIPSVLFRTGIKLLGYRMGRMESIFPPQIKSGLSMHPKFWANQSFTCPCRKTGEDGSPSKCRNIDVV